MSDLGQDRSEAGHYAEVAEGREDFLQMGQLWWAGRSARGPTGAVGVNRWREIQPCFRGGILLAWPGVGCTWGTAREKDCLQVKGDSIMGCLNVRLRSSALPYKLQLQCKALGRARNLIRYK